MRLSILLISLFFCTTIVGQNNLSKANQTKPITPKIQMIQLKDSIICNYLSETSESVRKPKYELYPTQNMWNFLKLNTITGTIYIVQYSLDGSEFQIPLNKTDLLWVDEPHVCGRFKLYPTQNMWNFILLDQINGNVWQVQWSTDPREFVIKRIRGDLDN